MTAISGAVLGGRPRAGQSRPATPTTAADQEGNRVDYEPEPVDLRIHRDGQQIEEVFTSVDVKDSVRLRRLLVDAARRDGRGLDEVWRYRMEIRDRDTGTTLGYFVVASSRYDREEY
jgi:hypothetical protein